MASGKRPAKKPVKNPIKQRADQVLRQDDGLLLRIQRILAVKRHVSQKSMFGGIAFFLYGNLLVGISKRSLIARIGPQNATEALTRPEVSEFKPTGERAMKGWVVISAEGLTQPSELETWVTKALEFVETLPAKPGNEEPLEAWVERSLRYA